MENIGLKLYLVRGVEEDLSAFLIPEVRYIQRSSLARLFPRTCSVVNFLYGTEYAFSQIAIGRHVQDYESMRVARAVSTTGYIGIFKMNTGPHTKSTGNSKSP